MKQQDGLHQPSILSPGGLFTQRKIRQEKKFGIAFNLLVEGNKEWVKNAAVLTVVISKKEFEYVDNRSKYCVKVYINQSEGLKIGLS